MKEASKIPAGTRCECRGDGEHDWRYRHAPSPCQRDAVRMVTVPNDLQEARKRGYVVVPMCAQCAAYHEAKANR